MAFVAHFSFLPFVYSLATGQLIASGFVGEMDNKGAFQLRLFNACRNTTYNNGNPNSWHVVVLGPAKRSARFACWLKLTGKKIELEKRNSSISPPNFSILNHSFSLFDPSTFARKRKLESNLDSYSYSNQNFQFDRPTYKQSAAKRTLGKVPRSTRIKCEQQERSKRSNLL